MSLLRSNDLLSGAIVLLFPLPSPLARIHCSPGTAYHLSIMSRVVFMVVSPILLLVSVPLAVLAAITTTFAFSTLFFRALILYAELAAALVQHQFATPAISSRSSASTRAKAIDPLRSHSRRKGRRSSTASGSSNGAETTPKAVEAGGFGMYSSGVSTRDFEGVGGWRIPGPDDEDNLWTNLNSRLELPTTADGRQRNHRRSQTSTSMTTMPMLSTSPTTSRARTPTRSLAGRTSSPEEYFGNRPSSKSTTALDTANIGRSLLRRKPSSSSGSSHSSVRTLHITSSNG